MTTDQLSGWLKWANENQGLFLTFITTLTLVGSALIVMVQRLAVAFRDASQAVRLFADTLQKSKPTGLQADPASTMRIDSLQSSLKNEASFTGRGVARVVKDALDTADPHRPNPPQSPWFALLISILTGKDVQESLKRLLVSLAAKGVQS